MEEKKKILIFLTRIPYPKIDGTRKKIMDDVIFGLKETFDLDLLVVGRDVLTGQKKNKIPHYFKDIKIFHLSFFKFILKSLKSFFSKNPLQVEAYFDKKVLKFIKENSNKYDAFYFHTIRTGKYLEKLEKKEVDRVFFDFNDAISLNYEIAQKKAHFPWNLIYSFEKNRVLNYEKKIIKFVKFANFVSSFDLDYLKNKINYKFLNFINFYNISSGVRILKINYFKNNKDNKIAFFGNLKYPPNKDAVNFFIKNIFPKINKNIDSINFIIAGKGSEGLKLKNKNLNIKKLGFVEDLDLFFKDILAIVAPIRFGAGVPTKILESLSRGIPVLTTEIGCRGFKYFENKNDYRKIGIICINEKNPKLWSDEINNLINTTGYREYLSENALRFIKANHDRDLIRLKYKEAFLKIINNSNYKTTS